MAERLVFDGTDELLATVAWSRISEPGEHIAGALVRALGPVAALDWVRSDSLQPPGVPAHIGWQAAAARWRPRLQTLDPRRELDMIGRRSGAAVPWCFPATRAGPRDSTTSVTGGRCACTCVAMVSWRG